MDAFEADFTLEEGTPEGPDTDVDVKLGLDVEETLEEQIVLKEVHVILKDVVYVLIFCGMRVFSLCLIG